MGAFLAPDPCPAGQVAESAADVVWHASTLPCPFVVGVFGGQLSGRSALGAGLGELRPDAPPVLLLQQRVEQVRWGELRMLRCGCHLLPAIDSLRRLDRELATAHGLIGPSGVRESAPILRTERGAYQETTYVTSYK